MRAGYDEFRSMSRKTNERFELDEDKDLPFTFTGFWVEKVTEGVRILHQHDYLDKLSILPEDASLSDFASIRIRLAWFAPSRPDCFFENSQLMQVTREIFEEDCRSIVHNTNKFIKHAKRNPLSIKFKKLDQSTVR